MSLVKKKSKDVLVFLKDEFLKDIVLLFDVVLIMFLKMTSDLDDFFNADVDGDECDVLSGKMYMFYGVCVCVD